MCNNGTNNYMSTQVLLLYMKYIFAGFLIFSILFCTPNYISAQTQPANEVNFFYENNFLATGWYNLTISDHFSIVSSNEYYNNLQIPFLSDPWSGIDTILKDNNFFNIGDTNDTNSNMVLHVIYNGNENTVHVSPDGSNSDLNNIFSYFLQILTRVTGNFLTQSLPPMWTSQISVRVMESYPEQYSVDALVTRGKDLLTVVNDYNATLIVSDYDFLANYFTDPNGSLLYAEKQQLSIASGGNSKEISFTTFSVGKDYSPDELYFTILLNGEYTTMLTPTGEFQIRHQSVDENQLPISSFPNQFSTTTNSNRIEILQWQVILSTLSLMVPIRLLYKKSKII